MSRPASDDQGFTLIEALVAMAVLAMGAVSLLSAAEGHTKHITDLTNRAAARWVADAAMAELRLGLPMNAQRVEMYGQSFNVTQERSETSDAQIEKITLRITQADSDQTLYVLDGYIDLGTSS